MKKTFLYIIAFFAIQYSLNAQSNELKLWYHSPAQKWTDALPIGNGNLGAMIYGTVDREELQFNESTIWTGKPRSYARPNAYKNLDTIRLLLNRGKQKEAEALAEKGFMGLKDVEDSVYQLQKLNWTNSIAYEKKMANVFFDDAKWPTMHIPTVNGWEQSIGDGLDGAIWFRTSFDLPESMLGKDLVIDLGRIRDLDYTYINGNLIGSTEGNTLKRSYTIKANFLREGKNSLAIQVLNFYDKGGFTGIKENKKVFVVYLKGGSADSGINLSLNWKYFIQNNNPPQYPQYEASYQPFGNLFFQFEGHDKNTNYRRELDLNNAIATVSYQVGDVNYKREYFASNPDQLIVSHFTANKKSKISLSAEFSTVHENSQIRKIDDHTIGLFVQVKDGAIKAVSYLYVASKGTVIVSDNKIQLKDADEASFYLIGKTNFINYKNISANAEENCKIILQKIKSKNYAQIKADHISDYQHLFHRFSIQLNNSFNDIATDERIKSFNIQKDASLVSLYVQYARYLLIASSRPNSKQPANLQGIWNDLLTPPWGSKFTTNINLEMNYWSADMLNLSDCTVPLFRSIQELSMAGRETAREHYHAGGWVLHHNTDLWKATAPINASNHGIWVTGGAWLSNMIWEHYLFTGDQQFLQKHYPIMKSAADFFTEFLVKDQKTGWLISTPSNSPEYGGLVAGPTMDHQIIRDLYKNTISASKVLKTDESISKMWNNKKNQIAPNQIGKYGQLQEWLQDIDDSSNKHRHVSHLWGVYPGTDITWKDSSFMKAAKQSLLFRGDEGTGWSIAWKTNLWARFKDGNHSMLMFEKLLSSADSETGASEKGGVYKNLFDAHPPFQIDGNFGGAAGIGEMLVQSHLNKIELLPALPDILKSGSVNGICARGGFVLNMKWDNAVLNSVTILSNAGKECWLQYGNNQVHFNTKKGMVYRLNSSLELL